MTYPDATAITINIAWIGQEISHAQHLRNKYKQPGIRCQQEIREVITMAVVKEVTKPEYTVSVHDDCYINRTPEEIKGSLERISKTILASQKRRFLESQRKEGKADEDRYVQNNESRSIHRAEDREKPSA